MHAVYTAPVRGLFPKLLQLIAKEVLWGRRSRRLGLCRALLDSVGNSSPGLALSQGFICLFPPKGRGQSLSWVPALAQLSFFTFHSLKKKKVVKITYRQGKMVYLGNIYPSIHLFIIYLSSHSSSISTIYLIYHLCVVYLHIIYFFFFSGLHQRHMEVPRLGVE